MSRPWSQTDVACPNDPRSSRDASGGLAGVTGRLEAWARLGVARDAGPA